MFFSTIEVRIGHNIRTESALLFLTEDQPPSGVLSCVGVREYPAAPGPDCERLISKVENNRVLLAGILTNPQMFLPFPTDSESRVRISLNQH